MTVGFHYYRKNPPNPLYKRGLITAISNQSNLQVLIKKMHFRNSELICELSDLSQTLKDSMEYHMDTNSECIHNLALIRIIHDKMLELHKKYFDIGIRINEILMK